MIELHFDTRTAEWLSNPPERWRAGLERGGLSFRQGLQRSNYAVQRPMSTYRRTGTLANKAAFEVAPSGMEMTFGATSYLPFLLFGTGIFGPLGEPITPLSANFLTWQAQAGPLEGQTIRVKSVEGTIWAGVKDRLLQDMVQGVKDGIRDYHGTV